MLNMIRFSRVLFSLAFALVALPTWGQIISVTSPMYRSDLHGTTTIRVSAPGFQGPLVVKSWLPGGEYGSDSTVASVALPSKGDGAFSFPADRYPHGPITLRITGIRLSDGFADTCYLQLYNTGGVSWHEGIPSTPPPAAAGMSVVFQDDFNGPLSVSATGVGARYGAHKPDGLDFSKIRFADPTPEGPFFQRDTYLIIRADANRNTTGLLSSINSKDGTGFTVKAPYYMECRFIAPDAIGTWPAWWTNTDKFKDGNWGEQNDEIDTVEAYGGNGPKNPNTPTSYMITPHSWGYQTGIKNKGHSIDMTQVGGGGAWSYTPHTYGLLVNEQNYVLYLDNVEVLRLPVSPLIVKDPSYFMVNLAVGGGSGWPVDLSRYGNVVDMYVDYIRVYH